MKIDYRFKCRNNDSETTIYVKSIGSGKMRLNVFVNGKLVVHKNIPENEDMEFIRKRVFLFLKKNGYNND